MHIPDGYLSPASAGVMYAAAAPFWYVATRRLKTAFSGRMVPLLSVFSALSFTIMMFNVPLPGGTSGHAVGGTLIAIILGPWAAVIGVSIALIIQALFFGDGGITAIGANCFNMAVVLPLVGYYVYRLISNGASPASRRHIIGGAVGGYLALLAASFLTAVEFGLQPIFWHTADGTPLYSPYGLDKAIPAMMIGSFVAGLAEAFFTGMVLLYFQRNRTLDTSSGVMKLGPQTWSTAAEATNQTGIRKRPRRTVVLWILLGATVVLSPLGLLATNPAWGEWGAEELQDKLGFVPEGLGQLSGIWNAPLSEYGVRGVDANFGYVLSAFVGVAIVVGVTWFLGKAFAGNPGQSTGNGQPLSQPAIRSAVLEPVGQPGRRRRRGFLERTVADLTTTMETTVFAEDTARLPGLLQRLDPRVKIIGILGFLIAVSFARSPWMLVAFYLLALVLAVLAKIPLLFYIKRAWLLLPFFTGVVALPAIFNFVTPGRPVVEMPAGLAITEQGLRTASLLILRVGTSVSFAALLVLTTRWPTLLKALRVLRVPQVFVLVLGMTHRYIFLLLHTANTMFLARQSRTVGRLSGQQNRRWLTGAVGTLIARSYQLSNEIYLAMVSRGFRGEALVIDDFRTRRLDWAWLGISLTIAAVGIWWEQVHSLA